MKEQNRERRLLGYQLVVSYSDECYSSVLLSNSNYLYSVEIANAELLPSNALHHETTIDDTTSSKSRNFGVSQGTKNSQISLKDKASHVSMA